MSSWCNTTTTRQAQGKRSIKYSLWKHGGSQAFSPSLVHQTLSKSFWKTFPQCVKHSVKFKQIDSLVFMFFISGFHLVWRWGSWVVSLDVSHIWNWPFWPSSERTIYSVSLSVANHVVVISRYVLGKQMQSSVSASRQGVEFYPELPSWRGQIWLKAFAISLQEVKWPHLATVLCLWAYWRCGDASQGPDVTGFKGAGDRSGKRRSCALILFSFHCWWRLSCHLSINNVEQVHRGLRTLRL